MTELSVFEKFSGLAINAEKCAVLKVGPFRHTEARYYTLKRLYWSPTSIKILGMNIHPDWEIMYQENFLELLDKVQDIIKAWSYRNQSLMGRIVIINHLINTLFIHKFLVLPTPKLEFFEIYKKMILEYLWDGKTPKIAYSKLVQNYSRLGLKLVDLRTKEIDST